MMRWIAAVFAGGLASAACAGDETRGASIDITTVAPEGVSPTTLLAFQDGDGPWETLESTTGHYRAHAETGSYGVLHVCGVDTGLLHTGIQYASIVERPAVTLYCGVPTDRASVKVNIQGDPAATAAVFIAGEVRFAASGDFAVFYEVLPGTIDVLVVALDESGAAQGFVALRDLDIAEGEALEVDGDLDAAVPADDTFVVELADAVGPYDTVASLLTRNGTEVVLSLVSDDDVTVYPAVPASVLDEGDLYRFSAVPTEEDEDLIRAARDAIPARLPSAAQWSRVATNALLELPASPTDVSLPTEEASLQVPADSVDLLILESPALEVTLAPGWLEANGHRWNMPVLDDVDGWRAEWGTSDFTWSAIAGWLDGSGEPYARIDQPPWLPHRPQASWDGRVESFAEVDDAP